MSATCLRGHASRDDAYCDVCGAPIGAGPRAAGADPGAYVDPGTPRTVRPHPHPHPHPAPAPAPAPARHCPDGHELLPGARFCEYDGWDSSADAGRRPPSPHARPRVPIQWQLVVIADRDRFDALREVKGELVADLAFPAYAPERRFPLKSSQVLVGRLSRSRGIDPDVDLGGDFADPGVSHAHAVLETRPDGTWCLIDLSSTNGTYLNDGMDRIVPQRPVPVGDGDQIHLGAWTTLVLRAQPSPDDGPGA
jgi:hypothetical protein